MLAHSLLFSKSTKGAARLNIPIRRMNRYQQYYLTRDRIPDLLNQRQTCYHLSQRGELNYNEFVTNCPKTNLNLERSHSIEDATQF